ncbi:MAG TPA: hypothetical protein VM536_00025 [Chloroflexia bacterium]|nr:hypothetical protein [Chloroflexia bacterium]
MRNRNRLRLLCRRLLPALLIALGGCAAPGLPMGPTATPALPLVQVSVAAAPLHRRHLALGLAQGGESKDPAYLRPAVPLIAALGIQYVRVDQVYDYPGMLAPRPGGGLIYDWAPLDTLVDDIRAMGAEPMLDLSYMPAALNPESNLLPPRDWDAWSKLVDTTVRHFNVDRGLGLRYWEIWNEPNLWGAWHGSYPQYLALYDFSRRAIHDRDPTAIVGGPALSLYEESALDWLLGFEQAQPDGGSVGFLSWHAYGWTPNEAANQVRAARALVARKQPAGPHPELMITELGVRTGGPGDTSVDNRADTPAAAAHLLASIVALEAAGLDKLFIFELRDGPHAGGEFWGRFGILSQNLHPKPIYHVLRAIHELGADLLPVTVSPARPDVGLLAAPGGRAILWHNGPDRLRTRVDLPAGTAPMLRATLFDSTHNNPRDGFGGDVPDPFGDLPAGALVFELDPDSVVLLEPVK